MISDNLINSISEIMLLIKEHNDQLDKDGSRFNIFTIINVSTREVRLHSSFISELLNPKGTHGYHSSFCKLFISQLLPIDKAGTLKDFDFDDYVVEVEKYIGPLNSSFTHGGKIDIIITDKNKKRVIIENKIFAHDQKYQLLRYYNYDPKALLIYLTLKGDNPSGLSTNNIIHKDTDFHCASYSTFISNWLEKCIEVSSTKPRVRETINQYLQVINNYSNLNSNNPVRTDIVELIASNKELYDSIELIIDAYNAFRRSINDKFWKQIRYKKPDETILTTEQGIEIKLHIAEDGDGFYFGFYLEQNGTKIKGTSEQAVNFALALKEINNSFVKNDIYIGWIYCNVFRKFYTLPKETIFKLNDDYEMNHFTDMVIHELDDHINKIKSVYCDI
jgi:hypothetical protein